ncbi:MAG: hypothetical protein FWD53_09610 [Phycisphaerales bacterium]|nr:hypothetical protein [Phycisphaerales bacterium]
MVAIRQATTVQPGGVIQIASDRLTAGVRAEVIVLVDELPSTPAMFPTMRSLIGAAQGSFKSAAETDAFLRAERDSWEN